MPKQLHNPITGAAVVAMIAIVAIFILAVMLRAPTPSTGQASLSSGGVVYTSGPDGGRYCNCESGIQLWCASDRNCEQCCTYWEPPAQKICDCGDGRRVYCSPPDHDCLDCCGQNVTIGRVPDFGVTPDSSIPLLYLFSGITLFLITLLMPRYHSKLFAISA